MDLAIGQGVRRALLVFRGPIDAETVKRRWATVSSEMAEFAVCYELRLGQDGVHEVLMAQRTVTEALREACGLQAETIPIFAVTDRDGDRVEDCAREWGATVVWT